MDGTAHSVCVSPHHLQRTNTHSWMTTKRKMYAQTVCLCVQPVCSGHTSSPHHSCCSGSHSPGVLWEPVGPACYMVWLSYHRHSCTKRAVVKSTFTKVLNNSQTWSRNPRTSQYLFKIHTEKALHFPDRFQLLWEHSPPIFFFFFNISLFVPPLLSRYYTDVGGYYGGQICVTKLRLTRDNSQGTHMRAQTISAVK